MANPAPALNDQSQPRPWLTRRPGECAYPSEGQGEATLSCCRPCDAAHAYCDTHRAAIKGPRGPSVADLLREYARFLA